MVDTEKLKIDFWKRLAQCPFMMVGLTGELRHVPLVAHIDKDIDDTIWFFTSKDGRLVAGGWAIAEFISKNQDYFASLTGTLTTEDDANLVDKFWSRQLEGYFPEGPTDPTLVLLRYEITEAGLGGGPRLYRPGEAALRRHVQSSQGWVARNGRFHGDLIAPIPSIAERMKAAVREPRTVDRVIRCWHEQCLPTRTGKDTDRHR